MKRVYLNVNESDIYYRFHNNYLFYFSSVAKKESFKRKLNSYIENETDKFINKYWVQVDRDTFLIMFAFILYSRTEKRGFKVGFLSDEGITLKTFFELPKFTITGYIEP